MSLSLVTLSNVDCELHDGVFLCTLWNAQYSTRTQKQPIYRICISTAFDILRSTVYFACIYIKQRNTEPPTTIDKLVIVPCKAHAWEINAWADDCKKLTRSQVKPYEYFLLSVSQIKMYSSRSNKITMQNFSFLKKYLIIFLKK